MLQINISIRNIDPMEYDSAAAHSPQCCPLVLAGDRRSGQSLLDGAAADSAVTICSLVQSAEGRKIVSNVAARFYRIFEWPVPMRVDSSHSNLGCNCCASDSARQNLLHKQSGTASDPSSTSESAEREKHNPDGPCSVSNARLADSNARLGENIAELGSAAMPVEAAGTVERPFGRRVVSFRFELESPLMEFMLQRGFAQLPARRLWNFGFRPERIKDIFNAIPHHLARMLASFLSSVEEVARGSMKDIADAAQAVARFQTITDGGADAIDSGTYPANVSVDPQLLEELWEEETELGLMQVDLEPKTQRRLRVMVNTRAASLWGLHREEMLARIALHEAPLPFADLDVLCNFVTEMEAALTGKRVLYVRLCVGNNVAQQNLLVRLTRCKIFNLEGQLCQASTSITPLPPPPPLYSHFPFPSLEASFNLATGLPEHFDEHFYLE